jgi:hypothetical protein
MRQVLRASVTVGIALLFCNLTLAANGFLTMENGTVLAVRTNTAGGTCNTIGIVFEDDSTGSMLTCHDSAAGASASANTRDGCVNIEGCGLCAATVPTIPPEADASTQVNCPGGVAYNISTGDTGGSCTNTGTGTERSGSCNSTATFATSGGTVLFPSEVDSVIA